MPEVMLLSHRGVQCVLPAVQVAVALADTQGTQSIELWPASPTTKAQDDRLLEVQTADGPKWLSCSNARLVQLQAEAVWELSPVLGNAVHLPFVVGLAELDEELLWLVDLDRYAVGTEQPLTAPDAESAMERPRES